MHRRNLRYDILVYLACIFFLVSCNSSLFKSRNDGNGGRQDNDNNSGNQYSEGSDEENLPPYTDEELEDLDFSNIQAETLRTENDGDTVFLSGTKIEISLRVIDGKKVSNSFKEKSKATFTYNGHNTAMNDPKQHLVEYGAKGLCPKNAKKVTYDIKVTRNGQDATKNKDAVVAARVDDSKELWVGIADNGIKDCSPMRFHSLDSWIIKFRCSDDTEIDFKTFACIDKNLTGEHLDNWIKEGSRAYKCKDYQPSCE